MLKELNDNLELTGDDLDLSRVPRDQLEMVVKAVADLDYFEMPVDANFVVVRFNRHRTLRACALSALRSAWYCKKEAGRFLRGPLVPPEGEAAEADDDADDWDLPIADADEPFAGEEVAEDPPEPEQDYDEDTPSIAQAVRQLPRESVTLPPATGVPHRAGSGKKSREKQEQDRMAAMAVIVRLKTLGKTDREVAAALNELGMTNAHSRRYTPTTVNNMIVKWRKERRHGEEEESREAKAGEAGDGSADEAAA